MDEEHEGTRTFIRRNSLVMASRLWKIVDPFVWALRKINMRFWLNSSNHINFTVPYVPLAFYSEASHIYKISYSFPSILRESKRTKDVVHSKLSKRIEKKLLKLRLSKALCCDLTQSGKSHVEWLPNMPLLEINCHCEFYQCLEEREREFVEIERKNFILNLLIVVLMNEFNHFIMKYLFVSHIKRKII